MMCITPWTYTLNIPFTADGNSLLPTLFDHQGPLGKVEFTHYAETVAFPDIFPVEFTEPFLGFCFNLEEEIRYRFNNEHEGKLFKEHYSLIYFPPGHLDIMLNEGDFSLFTVNFDKNFLKLLQFKYPLLMDLLNTVAEGKVDHPLPALDALLPTTVDMRNIIRLILYSPYEAEARDISFNALIMEMVGRCLEHIAGVQKGMNNLYLHSTRYKIENAKELVLHNLDYNWSIDLLASKVEMERKNFTRHFKKYIGLTLMDFLYEERMKKAHTLLSGTNLMIKEIAVAVGYRSAPSFSAAFKRKYNVYPDEIRKSDPHE